MKKTNKAAVAIAVLALVTLGANAFAATTQVGTTVGTTKTKTSATTTTKKKTSTVVQPVRRIAVGTVSSVGKSSLIVKIGLKKYTVAVASTTRVLNKNWVKINLSSIKMGDSVRIFGVVDTKNLKVYNTQTVRDISIPVSAAK